MNVNFIGMVFCINFLLSLGMFVVLVWNDYKLNKFEIKHVCKIMTLGFSYWILKIIALSILRLPILRNKHDRAIELKDKTDKLIESINELGNLNVNIGDMLEAIDVLEKSISSDLYFRAVNSYSDMLTILFKCSDGEGNIDFYNFEDIIKEAIKECDEIILIASNENENRLNEDKKIYYQNKKEDINKELEIMKNKNRDFKTMWIHK